MIQKSSTILTVNAGSSSLKFSLYEKESLVLVLTGAIERIGMEGTFISIQDSISGTKSRHDVTGDTEQILLETLTERGFIESLEGVGHRVVHGGETYHKPTRITDAVAEALERIAPYAPRHLPFEITLIQKLKDRLPHIPHVACFDTAFHHSMPREAQLIPVPISYRTNGVRRYGFHGLSYEYLLEALEETFGVPVKDKRVVLAHLGSGASLTAVQGGVSLDTTMGFTPNSGIPMSTRTGDLDAGLFEYFTNTIGLTVEAFNHMVNYESGLLAISGTTADMEVLLREAPTNESAEEAVSYFAYHVRKSIGALATVLGGIDILVFTGGIGERSAEMRSRIVKGLGFLTISLDEHANEGSEDGLISKSESLVSVYRIKANEERIIAKHVTNVLNDLV